MGDLNNLPELQKNKRKSELLIIQQKLALLRNRGKWCQKFLQSKNKSKKVKDSKLNNTRPASVNRRKGDSGLRSTKWRDSGIGGLDSGWEILHSQPVRATSVQRSKSRSRTGTRSRNTNDSVKKRFLAVEDPLYIETVLQSKFLDHNIKLYPKEKRYLTPKKEKQFGWGRKKSERREEVKIPMLV